MKKRHKNRKGIAAVEAAVCLPMLVIIWLGTVEVSQIISLKQQGQLLASTAANRVGDSGDSFADIETEVKTIADSLGIEGCDVTVRQFESEIVEASVSIDAAQNSTLSSVLGARTVASTYYSFRED